MVENQTPMCVRMCTPTTVSSALGGVPQQSLAEGRWKESKKNGERIRDGDGYRMRAAGVCLREEGTDGIKVLLVSGGKDGKQWVVPGGGIERDEQPDQAATRELEEEAGVRAQTIEKIGIFQDDNRKHRTTVFLMRVQEELNVWEDGQRGRRREWMSLTVGIEVVKDSQRAILRAVMQQ
ncbi:unnamed protein product, partial [Mesorhabditis belari]|uniref:diphosphoinositol-polyphosphate diphosphatase n=1 Tax=Mesorhabditis belari TaxID=2138241 RepID=A0AAF3ET31_9BILA